eukprot:TRINITY_DN3225_c0_g1_i1.p1 TRINITY_DN3225_c0_g1~~TRINITY_DN3225_c0_g1_i1.p1  ORF type:complete len:147 (+),score=19.23 TRINITY_DN3225_c0_g1_i1:108-548(+)
MGDEFHAVFNDEPQMNRRVAPMSGNSEKHRANRSDLHSSHRPKASDYTSLSIDDLLADPASMNFDRVGDNTAGGKRTERVITDNVADIERQMWEDAPKQGDYKLEDEWDQAYKDMMRDGGGIVGQATDQTGTGSASSSKDDDEFDF